MRKLPVTAVALVVAGPIAAGLIALPALQASASTKPLSNPCKSFTTHSVDRLLGIKPAKHPKRHLSTFNKGAANESKQCKVTYKSTSLFFDFSHFASGSGGGGTVKTYARPKLGKYGKVTESTSSTGFTSASYERRGIFVDDDYPGVKLPHHGKKMYTFALAQTQWLKKHA